MSNRPAKSKTPEVLPDEDLDQVTGGSKETPGSTTKTVKSKTLTTREKDSIIVASGGGSGI